MDGSKVVAGFCRNIRWEGLPSSVQKMARRTLLDNLASTLVGTLTRVSTIAAEYAQEAWSGSESMFLLKGVRGTAVGAAFANGCAANGLDIDDCGLHTKGHPGALIFPTALAVAESLAASGKELLTAMVVGYEVAHRAGRIWHATHDEYQACGSWGSVACAAATAHLQELPVERIQQALGIADYHAPNLPMMRDVDFPAMVKHGIGWGTVTGINAVNLASRGFSSVPSLFSDPPYQHWVEDIGSHYIMVDGIAWKAHACCAWVDAALEAVQRLVDRHCIAAADVQAITVRAPQETVRLGTELPQTTEEAQFNAAWPLAAFLIDGKVGPAQMLEERLSDERIRTLCERIQVIEDEELNELHQLANQADPRGKFAAHVSILLHDGREVEARFVEGGVNFPQQGWDDQRLEKKFRWLVGHVLPDSLVEELIGIVWHFEQVPDTRELTALLA